MTLYFKDLTYIAVPKTGSISIEKAFRHLAHDYKQHQHDSIDKVKKISDNETIAIVRHPLEWIQSYYKYLRHSPYFAASTMWGIKNKPFDKFLEQYIRGVHMWPEPLSYQSSYIERHGHKVDTIYKFENIQLAIDHINRVNGTDIEIGFHNVSPKIDLHITPELESRLIDKLEKDFQAYENAI